MASSPGSPCGACKFLRRKCRSDCIFAPYFKSMEQFAAIHKVFGASNASRMLLRVPLPHRCDAAVAITYEARARLRDPVYGCVGHIFTLQQQVASLQGELMQVKAQLAHACNKAAVVPRSMENQSEGRIITDHPPQCWHYKDSMSSQSSLDCTDYNSDVLYDNQRGSQCTSS